MESFIKHLQKIEQPLRFAAGQNFKNLNAIKSLGKSLTALIARLMAAIPPGLKNRLEPALGNLMLIFSDYDDQDIFVREKKISEALLILDRLKDAIEMAEARKPISPFQDKLIEKRILDVKVSAEKLSVPVQYLKGVVRRWPPASPQKKFVPWKICFFFCPVLMKTDGKSGKSTSWKREKFRQSLQL